MVVSTEHAPAETISVQTDCIRTIDGALQSVELDDPGAEKNDYEKTLFHRVGEREK